MTISPKAPPNPQILDDVRQRPNQYKLTTNDKQFILCDGIDDYSTSNQRIIIFCTSNSLELISESNHWFSDGIFSNKSIYYTINAY